MASVNGVPRFLSSTAIIAFGLITGGLIWFFDDWQLGEKTLYRATSAATAATLVVLFVAKWAWKDRPFRWFHSVRDLGGTWLGHLQSSWDDGDDVPTPIPIVFVVKQSFVELHIQSYTAARHGSSYVAHLLCHEGSGENRLVYVYSLREEFKAGEGAQQGAAEVRIVFEPNLEMRGEYWTNTETRGTLLLRRQTDEHVTSFESAAAKWKVSRWPSFVRPV
jgi:hypothetical protein